MADLITNSETKSSAALNPFASAELKPVNYQTGYQAVDNLTQAGNQALQNSVNAQTQAINAQTQQNVNELQRQKDIAVNDTSKLNQGLYAQYQKQINPYGATQEALAGQGLGHSGVAESTRTSIYNNYQRSVSENLQKLSEVKGNYDAQMAQARTSGDLATAEALSNAYLQQLSMIQNAYSMAQAQKEFEWQKSVDERNYNYQVERDKIADQQWRDQFNLSQQAKSSSGSSRSSKSSSSSGLGSSNGLVINPYAEDSNISIGDRIANATKAVIKKLA